MLQFSTKEKVKYVHFDSDSFKIAVDNCCTRCLTNNLQDFIGKPTPITSPVVGIGGTTRLAYKGTVWWNFEDNQGIKHTFDIPNSVYQPDACHSINTW